MQFPQKILLIDLETTGLNRERDQIISIGMSYLSKEGTLTTSHWFLENPNEEKELLTKFLDLLSNYTALFSYYGKGFEFPFILSRLKHYDLDSSAFLKLKLIDLKSMLKHFAKNRKDLEQLFDYKRQCQSSGQDIIKLYQTYIATKSEIYKNCILEHQKEEMSSLLLFWELYNTLYTLNRFKLISQDNNENVLILKFKALSFFTHSFLGNAYNMRFSYSQNQEILEIWVPLLKIELYHDLEPLKDYYFIESQKQLIHKSLAQFIPASLKRKATKEECNLSKMSLFLPIRTKYKLNVPLWHDCNKQLYIEYTDFTIELLFNQLFHLFFSSLKEVGMD